MKKNKNKDEVLNWAMKRMKQSTRHYKWLSFKEEIKNIFLYIPCFLGLITLFMIFLVMVFILSPLAMIIIILIIGYLIIKKTKKEDGKKC